MLGGRKTTACDEEVAESKAVENGTTASVPQAPNSSSSQLGALLRKADVAHVCLRLLCMASSVTALSSMLTARQASIVTIYGFHLPVYSKWSFAQSFVYVVGVTAAVTVYSLLQLLISGSKLVRKSPMIPSRNHAWVSFAGDQVFAYALMSAGSAASGVSNLNRTGIRHTPLPNFCKPLNIFCNHIAISIAFTFLSCLLLATSAVQSVIWLSNN
ncbi:PREDICTED: CASP-like protein 3A2 [Fragaria vesca subsp. vesca]|uniref:CASP-like protein 3A2 n=1 Tax=Fragaria vesca subsp. vesca TaxID=101020 RepID=UPI0002C36F6F|nr:PREDICTED: CASP-like protein 3A2 [Fragaria vesca subsp. vesca]